MPVLPKSRSIAGLRCRMLLWAQYNARERFPEADLSTPTRFDQGHMMQDVFSR